MDVELILLRSSLLPKSWCYSDGQIVGLTLFHHVRSDLQSSSRRKRSSFPAPRRRKRKKREEGDKVIGEGGGESVRIPPLKLGREEHSGKGQKRNWFIHLQMKTAQSRI